MTSRRRIFGSGRRNCAGWISPRPADYRLRLTSATRRLGRKLGWRLPLFTRNTTVMGIQRGKSAPRSKPTNRLLYIVFAPRRHRDGTRPLIDSLCRLMEIEREIKRARAKCLRVTQRHFRNVEISLSSWTWGPFSRDTRHSFILRRCRDDSSSTLLL